MKICVYTIAKNEEHHVERLCNSAKDADLILILDTGSTDKTVEVARQHGAQVYEQKIFPWRYDEARNRALALIPDDFDVCVAMDMDEYLAEGWRAEIERLWVDGVNQINYVFKITEKRSFVNNKIHGRFGYFWQWPVHECLSHDVRIEHKTAQSNMTIIVHDPKVEAKLDKHHEMLEFAVKQFPESGRMVYYYARDLVNLQKWEKAIPHLKKYLTLDTRKNAKERAVSMLHLGRCYEKLGKPDESIEWFRSAVFENPLIKDSWYDLAHAYFKHKRYPEAYATFLVVPSISKVRNELRDNSEMCGYAPWDWASIAASRTGMKEAAAMCCELALEYLPNDDRMTKNLEAYRSAIPKKKPEETT
jgi:glycosyltransferase involved in cell wall biosynthesis